MENSDKSNQTINLNALSCDAVTKSSFAEIPSDYALTVTRPCEEVHKDGILSCKNPHCDQYFDEGGGLNLHTKKVTGAHSVLPFYIPIPCRDVLKLPIILPHTVVGVRLKDVFPNAIHKRDGLLRFSSAATPNMSLADAPVYANAKLMLFYSGPDVLIEGVNREKYVHPVYEVFKDLGITLATSPDFSVNEGSCTLGQMINTNRTLAIGEEMNRYGIAVLPNVFAINPHLLASWMCYLNMNPAIGTIAINCQRQRKNQRDMNVLIDYILMIFRSAPPSLHIVLHGFPIMAKDYLLQLKRYACQLHFAESAPFYNAVCKFRYQVYNPVTKELVEIEEASRDPGVRARMIEMSIMAREQYLLEVFYSGSTCSSYVFPELMTVQR